MELKASPLMMLCNGIGRAPGLSGPRSHASVQTERNCRAGLPVRPLERIASRDDAAIIGGWAASNDYYDANKETLAKLIKGWAEANDYIIGNNSEALASLQKAHYSQTPLADINEQFKAQKMFSSHEWKRLYSDGTVTNWLQQSTDFFMANAGIKDFTPASKYFDSSLYLKTVA